MHPYECMRVLVIKMEVLCRSDVHVRFNSTASMMGRVERSVNCHVYFLLNALLFLRLFGVIIILFFSATQGGVCIYTRLKNTKDDF